MSKIICELFSETYLALITGIIIITWCDLFWVKKNKQQNFKFYLLCYIAFYLFLEFFMDLFFEKVADTSYEIRIIHEAFQMIIEMWIGWLLFVKQYKERVVVKVPIYLLIVFVIPLIEMFVVNLVSPSLVKAGNAYKYIEMINDFTLMLTVYLILVISGELKRRRKYLKSNLYILPFVLILVIQLSLHYLFENIIISNISEVRAERYLLLYVLSATIFFCLCMIYKKYLKDQEYRRIERERINFYERQIGYYKRAQERLGNFKKTEHDMKNHLLVIKGLSQSNKNDKLSAYIDRLEEHVSLNTKIIEAGNAVVSAQLTYAMARCDESGIVLKYLLDYDEITLGDFELNIILGNVLDNAIEASLKTTESEEKIIRLSIQQKENVFMIGCANHFKGVVSAEAKQIFSTKENGENHRLGLGNIREVAESHEGKVEIKIDKQCFDIHIILHCIPE